MSDLKVGDTAYIVEWRGRDPSIESVTILPPDTNTREGVYYLTSRGPVLHQLVYPAKGEAVAYALRVLDGSYRGLVGDLLELQAELFEIDKARRTLEKWTEETK